jgi:glutamine synthetase
MCAALDKLAKDTKTAEEKSESLEMAAYYEKTVLADMDELRKYADTAEALIPDKYLSYPTYGQMLFSLR